MLYGSNDVGTDYCVCVLAGCTSATECGVCGQSTVQSHVVRLLPDTVILHSAERYMFNSLVTVDMFCTVNHGHLSARYHSIPLHMELFMFVLKLLILFGTL